MTDKQKLPCALSARLGAEYTKALTVFRVWAPLAKKAEVRLYLHGDADGSPPMRTLSMAKDRDGVFSASFDGDADGVYYNLCPDTVEVRDPYARAVGVNGDRCMVADFSRLNPDGWEEDGLDAQIPIIYEVHVRDFSSHPLIKVDGKGGFTAFCAKGIKTPAGKTALLDYLIELGVTYVHLQPVFDFDSTDERTREPYNWGYDPKNYNALEGSYSTDPFDGHVRIREFKRLVKALHDAKIGVILDVVYNHTSGNFFEDLVPDYYYRKNGGVFCNGSLCGNETDSTAPMFRKFMTESVTFFAKEYHVDGFRFDLMGLHDVDTLNGIRAALDNLFEDGRGKRILMYGEPWRADGKAEGYTPCDTAHAKLLDARIAVFSPTARDGIRGEHFTPTYGYASGKLENIPLIEASLSGGTSAKAYGADFTQVRAPSQQIIYASAHDDYTLYDQMALSMRDASLFDILTANKIAAFLVMTGFGIPFFLAGEEFLRTKNGSKNSYNLPDSVNGLDWSRRDTFCGLTEYYRGLIAARKALPQFADLAAPKRVEWMRDGGALARIGEGLAVLTNPTKAEASFDLSALGGLDVYADIDRASAAPFSRVQGVVTLKPLSVLLAAKI